MPLDRTFFGVFEPRSVSDACDDTKTPPTSPSAVASQLNCLLVVPASAAPGYAGVLQWDCSGMLPPGDSGFVNFEVRILD